MKKIALHLTKKGLVEGYFFETLLFYIVFLFNYNYNVQTLIYKQHKINRHKIHQKILRSTYSIFF